MKHLLFAASTLVLLCGATGLASAAEEVIVEEHPYATTRVYRDSDYRDRDTGRYVETRESPVVYGWSFRPPNCGVFHYWNGEECVDARDVPPPQ
jgi:hypothetical protein